MRGGGRCEGDEENTKEQMRGRGKMNGGGNDEKVMEKEEVVDIEIASREEDEHVSRRRENNGYLRRRGENDE